MRRSVFAASLVKPRIPGHVLFIQGGDEGVHDQWDNRMVESLARNLGPNYEIRVGADG